MSTESTAPAPRACDCTSTASPYACWHFRADGDLYHASMNGSIEAAGGPCRCQCHAGFWQK